MMPLLTDCLPIQLQIMIRMVRFMQSCSKCNNTNLKILSHLALQGNGSYMSKRFNYILLKLNRDVMTFCSMKSNNFYEMVQHHHQVGLDEQLMVQDHHQVGLNEQLMVQDHHQVGLGEQLMVQDHHQVGLNEQLMVQDNHQVGLDEQLMVQDHHQVG